MRSSQLQVGDTFPELCLKSIQGQEIALPDSEHNYIHLQFRRYAGCPVCNLHLRDFAKRYGEIEAAGIREIVVFHSSVAAMLPYQGDLPFDAVAEPEKRLYKRFGVESSPLAILNPAAWPAVLKGMMSTKPTSKREGGPSGLPADILIARNGQIKSVKYGRHADDQWSVDELLALSRSAALSRH